MIITETMGKLLCEFHLKIHPCCSLSPRRFTGLLRRNVTGAVSYI